MMNESFGKTIKKRRKRIGIKGVELAQRIGVTKAYISKMELHNALPSPAVQKKLSKVLGIDLQKHYIKNKMVKFHESLSVDSNWTKSSVRISYPMSKTDKPKDKAQNFQLEILLEGPKNESDEEYARLLLRKACPEKANDRQTINTTKKQIQKLRKSKWNLMKQIKDVERFLNRMKN